MTSTPSTQRSDSLRRWSVGADLLFWSAAGAVVAASSRPLGDWWHASRAVLLGTGLTFAALGPVMLLGLSRTRPVSARLVAAFVVTNLGLAPVALAAARYGWLGLSRPGNWALADAAMIMGALGFWQLTALLRSRHDRSGYRRFASLPAVSSPGSPDPGPCSPTTPRRN